MSPAAPRGERPNPALKSGSTVPHGCAPDFLHQWDEYQQRAVPCPDCAWLLLAFVRELNATVGTTRPDVERLRRLTRRPRRWVVKHTRHLVDGGHIEPIAGP